MPQVFILGREGPGRYRVRLAGGFLVDLFGRELRHSEFPRLWEPAARTPLQLVLEALRRHPEPVVIQGRTANAHGSMDFEAPIAPLRGTSGQTDRMIGIIQPVTPVAGLGAAAVRGFALRSVISADSGADPFPRLRLAAIDGREIA